MEVIGDFFINFVSLIKKADFYLLSLVLFTAFGFIFVMCFAACLFSDAARRRSKRPFYYLTCMFAALCFAVFATKFTAGESLFVAALFWCAGIILYGILCLFKPKKRDRPAYAAEEPDPVSSSPFPVSASPAVNPAPSAVRLDHAISIADKLLVKTLGRADRQELERIKTSLTVLKVKGSLTASEGDALNETFNTLLKLMAKYDL